MDALWAQLRLDDAYDWKRELAEGKAHWCELNPEAQAELLEDAYDQGRPAGATEPVLGSFFAEDPVSPSTELPSGADHTAFARETARYVRSSKPWRLSRFL